jgi:hypothetical protein
MNHLLFAPIHGLRECVTANTLASRQRAAARGANADDAAIAHAWPQQVVSIRFTVPAVSKPAALLSARKFIILRHQGYAHCKIAREASYAPWQRSIPSSSCRLLLF